MTPLLSTGLQACIRRAQLERILVRPVKPAAGRIGGGDGVSPLASFPPFPSRKSPPARSRSRGGCLGEIRRERRKRWRSRARGWPWSSSSVSARPTASRCRKGRTRSAPGRRCPALPASALACGRPTSTARGARLTCEPVYVGTRDTSDVPAISTTSFGF